jgi:hypothetical protein
MAAYIRWTFTWLRGTTKHLVSLVKEVPMYQTGGLNRSQFNPSPKRPASVPRYECSPAKHIRTTAHLTRSTSPILLPFLRLLLRDTLTFEPVAIEAVFPKQTRSVRCGVVDLALLSCGAIDAAARGGVLIDYGGLMIVGGHGMRSSTVRAPYAF